MTSAKCFLGCTNVRYGARIVSIVDFWIGVILLIKCLTLLNPFYDNIYSNYKSRAEQISYDLVTFSHLFLISVFLNVNYYLKESTYDHKVHKIYQWLAINTIFLCFYILAITYITVKNYYPEILYYLIPVSIIHLCQIYVVKSFYDDELHIISTLSTATSATVHNNVAVLRTNSSQGSAVNVTLNPSASNPIYHVQNAPPQQQQEAGRPHCINCVAHPVPVLVPGTASSIYPQLHHDQSGHDGPEPDFQAGPSEVQHIQEYYNPPAYSPEYDHPPNIHCARMI